MKNLDEELEQVYDIKIPEPDLSRLDKFDEKLKKNKQKRKRIVMFRRLAVACAMVLVVTLSVLIPILNRPKEVVKYYGDNNTIQVDVTQDFVKDYINENLPNYNFIFEDCILDSQYAIYDKDTSSKLLALRLQIDKNSIPFTSISINIILDKNYIYSKHSTFVNGAVEEPLENKTIYSLEKNDGILYSMLTLIERETYNTYLQLSINDVEILNKFKQN